MKRGLLFICIVGTLALACSAAEKMMHTSAAATAAPSPNAPPTDTASPTAAPTSTPRPTACIPSPQIPSALQSAQDKAGLLVPGAKVTWYDDFICDDLSYGWQTGNQNPTLTATAASGVVTITAEPRANLYDGLNRKASLIGDNRGMLVSFRYRANSSINLFIITGNWQTPGCRRWGLDSIGSVGKDPFWEGWEGTDWLSGDFPSGLLHPGAWYYLFIRLGNAGQVTTKVWEKAAPENSAGLQRQMGSTWTGLNWNPLFQVYQGALELDEYWELEFITE